MVLMAVSKIFCFEVKIYYFFKLTLLKKLLSLNNANATEEQVRNFGTNLTKKRGFQDTRFK